MGCFVKIVTITWTMLEISSSQKISSLERMNQAITPQGYVSGVWLLIVTILCCVQRVNDSGQASDYVQPIQQPEVVLTVAVHHPFRVITYYTILLLMVYCMVCVCILTAKEEGHGVPGSRQSGNII